MKAFEEMTIHRSRVVWACATSLLVIACGGGEDAAPVLAAPTTAVDARDTAMAAAGTDRVAKTKMPRGRAWRGITAMDVAPDGSVALAGADGSVQVRPENNGNQRGELSTMVQATGVAATAVAFSADGKQLVSVGRDSVARVWSMASRTRLLSLHGHEHPIRTVAVSRDGVYVASAGEESRVMVWSATTGQLVKVLAGHASFVNTVAFSPDGRMLAAGDASGKVALWNIANGAPRQQLAAHRDEVNSLAFSPDGRVLATAGEDGLVLLWDAVNGQKLHTLEGHQGPVRALAFSRDGQWLASGGQEARVLVWNMTTGALSRTLPAGAAVNALAFDVAKRKQVVMVGGEDGLLARWDIAVGAKPEESR